MATTVLGGVLDFFKTLGVYDVVLPFVLVFSIVFAILERTAIFGKEKIGEKEWTKKNLNAMVSFTMAFLVIASSKLVETITQVSSQIVVLLLLSVFFLMLVGTFFTAKELEEGGLAQEKGWRITFMFIMFIGTVFIFLNAIKNEAGKTWLQVFLDWLLSFSTDVNVAAVVLIIAVILFIYWITKPKEEKKEKST